MTLRPAYSELSINQLLLLHANGQIISSQGSSEIRSGLVSCVSLSSDQIGHYGKPLPNVFCANATTTAGRIEYNVAVRRSDANRKTNGFV